MNTQYPRQVKSMDKIKLGFAVCGSFCTLNRTLSAVKELSEKGYDITPILSPIVQTTDTRFIKASDFKNSIEEICKKESIVSIVDAEPIGPKKMFDALIVCPCTGNTLAKLTYGITDTCVTMAVKAHIRNNRPAVIAVSTNDALSASAKNIGYLLNTKNFYFVPYRQDDPLAKERSIVADFSLIEQTVLSAIEGKQLRPIII